MLPNTQFVYQIYLHASDMLVCVPYTVKHVGEWAGGNWIVENDFSAAFDTINNQIILGKICILHWYWKFCVIYSYTVSIKLLQHVMVDGCRSKLVNVLSEVSQQFFGPVNISPV